jgi:hypothetical protein
MTALFVVRAEVADPADREAFDTWYRDVHLPHFVSVFKADRAWRTWSRTKPAVHVAYYEFKSHALAHAIPQSADIKPLIAEFDAAWGGRVTRTREIEDVVQTFPSST